MSKVSKSTKNESQLAYDVPATLWTKVGTDLSELKDKSYLVVDYTTNFILVYFQINDLLPLLLIQKEFSPSLESLRKLYQMMDLNILNILGLQT